MNRISEFLFGGLTQVWQILLMSFMYLLLLVSIVFLVLKIFQQVQSFRERQTFSARIKDRFARTYHKRVAEEEQKWLEEGEQETVSLMYKMDRLIDYSGIRSRLPWLTSDILMLVFVIICLMGFFVGHFTALGAFIGFLMGIAVCFVIRSAIRFMADTNYDAIETDLLKFLNAVDSASGSKDDLISIFKEVSHSMCRPLKHALDTCCREAASTGDVKRALKHLELSVENTQFCVIIRNLGMAAETSSDYGVVLDECRLGLREHISAREERKVQISSGRTALLQLVGIGSLSFLIMGKIVDVDNIFTYLWGSFAGKIVLIYNITVIFFCLMDAIMLRGRK